MLTYAQAIALIVLLFLFPFQYWRRHCKNPLFIDWPFLGMGLQLLYQSWQSQFHEFLTQALKQQACTANFKGPWFTKLNYVFTCDPINVQHTMSKNFDNYVRGPDFRENFDVLGDGIIGADSDTWKYSRTLLHSLLKNINFDKLCEKVIHKKIESGLLPVLDKVIEQGGVDLQDIFKRFNFDYFCSILFGHDPQFLAIEFPDFSFGNSFAVSEELVFYRHMRPKGLWKLERWLQIGAEKRLAAPLKIFDEFIYQQIASKKQNSKSEEKLAQADLLTSLMREEESGKGKLVHDDKFLRDTVANIFIAGRETLTSALIWFFWHVATHPSVETKIIEELKEKIVAKGQNPSFLGVEEGKNLVYLHGAICESLRLFPPLSLEFRQAIKSDVLPSGHTVDRDSMILFSFYSMGRLEESWGKDYLEFKPERWLSDTGNIVYVPFHKFVSFGTGPRICLGKNMSFMTLKIVASAILWNYHVQVVKDHPITPTISIVIMMKHGMKVKLENRK